AFFRNHEPIAVPVNENGSLDEISRRRLVPVPAVFGELPFLDQLVEDVLDLPAGDRSSLEIFENPLQSRAAVRAPLPVAHEVFPPALRPPAPLPASRPILLNSHNFSLLTNTGEEHRFDIAGRNGGTGRRTRFRF